MLYLKDFLVLFFSKFQRLGILLGAILSLDLLINLVLFAFYPGLFQTSAPEPVSLVEVPVTERSTTSTPYQPLFPTRTLDATATLPATSTPIPGPSTEFYGVDFGDPSARIRIHIQPQSGKVNQGKPIVIAVNPGSSCYYEDHRACVSAYRTGEGNNIIFISVHSGIGGEAEAYRRAVEGTGINRAAFSMKMIRSNLERLEGAPVKIVRGDVVIDGLSLTSAARVPSKRVRDYFSGSIEQGMAVAAAVNPSLEGYLNPDSPILVIETCGWKHPVEPWAPGVTSTTGSVYVSVIQLAP